MQVSEMQNIFLRIRSNKVFELFVISVIIFSALLVGAKTYQIPKEFSWITLVMDWFDWFITAFFLVEITIRFLAEHKKVNFFKSFWNLFDTTIVLFSLMPIDNSEAAVIARLIRVFRVLRMVSFIPELRILLTSLIKALPQLGYVMLLMFIIFYIYAAVGSTLFHDINPTLWGDIAISLLTLFRVMTFEDWTDVMYETMEMYPLSWVYYISFIFFTAFAFLNMVIGIVVNVMEQEHAKVLKAEQEANHEPTMKDLEARLVAMQSQLEKLTTSKD